MTPSPETIAAVDAALTSRRSVRAFLPTPVPRQTVEEILAVASRAPSGTNTQPWKVYVLTGASQAALSRKILDVYDDPRRGSDIARSTSTTPPKWVSPYIERRRKVGWDMYGAARHRQGRQGAHARPASAATTSSSTRRWG